MRGCSRDFAASKRVPLGHSSQQALVTIKQAADAFKAKGNARITATGHTDASGPESYNTSGVRRGSGKATITGRLFSFEREHDSTDRKTGLALIWLVSCRMDRTKLQRRLELATTHIARGEEHIARQHQSIWELEQDGQDTTEAWCLLAELEAAQALHVVDRDQLIKEMADKS